MWLWHTEGKTEQDPCIHLEEFKAGVVQVGPAPPEGSALWTG